MWLFTTFGFFSIVQKQPSDDFLTVRARDAADLQRLRDRVPQLSPTVTGAGTDYPYRAKIPHAELALALANIVREIHYSNYKTETKKELGHGREDLLMQVWSVMHGLGTDAGPRSLKSRQRSSSSEADAFGGIVIDAQDQILLRKPSHHYGGYVWTFAKGRPNRGETPEETALREVREELGVDARIVEAIPGYFGGDTSTTQFFLMHHVRDLDGPLEETQETRWVSLSEARSLIKKTTTPKGRQRDLAVLDATQKMLTGHHGAE